MALRPLYIHEEGVGNRRSGVYHWVKGVTRLVLVVVHAGQDVIGRSVWGQSKQGRSWSTSTTLKTSSKPLILHRQNETWQEIRAVKLLPSVTARILADFSLYEYCVPETGYIIYQIRAHICGLHSVRIWAACMECIHIITLCAVGVEIYLPVATEAEWWTCWCVEHRSTTAHTLC